MRVTPERVHELLEVPQVQWHRTFEGLEEDAIGRIAQPELRVMHEHGAPHAVACTLQLLPHLLPSARGLHSDVKERPHPHLRPLHCLLIVLHRVLVQDISDDFGDRQEAEVPEPARGHRC